jgi:crotonobetainyl-CoA:carnitine CoA-transferase CaiB-like acyl-CoA transferase
MSSSHKPLKGIRVLSLSLNLPGPAALLRCKQMGATCVKLEPPSGDPMRLYEAKAYADLHPGIRVISADLKTAQGQKVLHRELAHSDILLTSFRPSALNKLGLDWTSLHRQYPALSLISIVGVQGAGAEEPGHDLTYLASQGLVQGLTMPATLFADMAGALMAAQAVLEATLMQYQTGRGSFQQVALSDAAAWLAMPRHWGLTQANGAVGGAHAGYRVYDCQDGRVAVAALEPHFAAALCAAAGVNSQDQRVMFVPATHRAIADFLQSRTCRQLEQLAKDHDIPLHTLPAN